jgi:hypothetical protein
MIDCSLQRWTAWPGAPTTKRRTGAFQVTYLRLLEDLSSELRAIGAKSIELALDIPDGKLSRSARSYDGWPKADAPVNSPGVILRFDRGETPMQFACDTYSYWEHNLRAIGRTLEALRAVSRYGATSRNEQYRGYERQIAAPTTESVAEIVRRAARTVVTAAGTGDCATILVDRKAFGAAFRQASANVIKAHGPDSEQLRELNRAGEILKERVR